MISLLEPLWAREWFISLYYYIQQTTVLYYSVPVLADVFVFSYPVYLVGLYLFAIFFRKDTWKESALFTFFSVLTTVFVNIFVLQFFFEKQRPNVFFNLVAPETGKTLLDRFLPSSSFPSDHAVVGTSFAAGILFWWIYNKDKKFIFIGSIFLLFAFVMSFCRVASGVHWITDVLAGTLLWILIPFLMIQEKNYKILKKYLFSPLIKLQKMIIDR